MFDTLAFLLVTISTGWGSMPISWEEQVQAGNVHRRKGDYAEAEKTYRMALQVVGNGAEGDYGRAVVLNNLGLLRKLQNRLSEAETLFRRALAFRPREGRNQPDWIAGTIQNNLGITYFSIGLLREADAALRSAMYACEANPMRFTLNCAGILNDLAVVSFERGMVREAAGLYQRSISALQTAPQKDNLLLAKALDGRAAVLIALGSFMDAEALLLQARELREPSSPDPTLAKILGRLAILYAKQGSLDSAEQLLSRALKMAEETSARGELVLLLCSFGWLRFEQHRFTEADVLFRRSLAEVGEAYPKMHPRWVSAMRTYGDYLQKTGRKREAKAVSRQVGTRCDRDPESCLVVDVHALRAAGREAVR